MKKVQYVNWADDWDALYIDGKLVLSDHSLYAPFLLELLAEHGVIEFERGPSWEDEDVPWSIEDGEQPPEYYEEIFD